MAPGFGKVLVWVTIIAVVVVAAAATFVGLAGGPRALQEVLPQLQSGTLSWHPFGGGSDSSAIADAEQALSRGDPTEARHLAEKAVDKSASDAEVLNRAGNVAVQTGDDALAERAYSLGESADPRYAWNFVELGQLYARRGDVSQADAHLRAAVGLAPDAQFLHYDLGVVELREHLYAAALADFEAELHRSPHYDPALAGRAEALKNLGRKAEAALALRSASAKPKGPLQLQRVQTPVPRASVTPAPTPAPAVRPSPSPLPTKLAKARPAPVPKPKPKAAAKSGTVVAAAAAPLERRPRLACAGCPATVQGGKDAGAAGDDAAGPARRSRRRREELSPRRVARSQLHARSAGGRPRPVDERSRDQA